MNFPHDVEIEKALLGAALRGSDGLDSILKLTVSDFYKPSHVEAYSAVAYLSAGGLPVNVATVSNRLRETNALDVIGGPDVIREWMARSSDTQSQFLVDKLRDLSARRRLIEISGLILAAATNEEEPIDVACERFGTSIQSIVTGDSKELPTFAEGMRATLDKLTEGAKNGRPPIEIPTGITGLDFHMCGLHRQELTVIAGKTSAGKTALAVQIACHVAKRSGPALLFSLEMPAHEIHKRLYSMESTKDSDVNMQNIRSYALNASQLRSMEQTYSRIYDAELIIDDTSDVSLKTVRQRARQMKTPPCLIVVDYLQIMRLHGTKNENRTRELDEASRLLKLIARDFNCAVITLSQLNRNASGADDKRPSVDHLRESAAIAFNADNVLFVHSASYDASPESKPPEVIDTEIIVAKQRNGPRNVKIDLQWRPAFVRFEEKCDSERAKVAEQEPELNLPPDSLYDEDPFGPPPEDEPRYTNGPINPMQDWMK